MGKAKVLMAVMLAAVAAGCLPSLHPLYTDQTLVVNEALFGTWAPEGEDPAKDSWTFTKADEKSYELVVAEDGVPAKFEAHLVKLGEHLFLDTFPGDVDVKHELLSFHLVPVHWIWKVALKEDTLSLAPFSGDWVDKAMKEKKLDVKYEVVDDTPLLTAQPEELQKFVLKAAEDPEAFVKADAAIKLLRQKPKAAPTAQPSPTPAAAEAEKPAGAEGR